MSWRLSRRKLLSDFAQLFAMLPLPRFASRAFFTTTPEHGTQDTDFTLWFSQPAAQWSDALPVGNGRLGAMIFGGYRSERLALNEDSLWSGGPRDWNNPDAKAHLPVVRKLVLERQNYQEADRECRRMQGPFNQAFQPLADLVISFDHSELVSDYRRSLDLDSGIAKISYRAAGATFTREIFSSAPAQLLVVRLTCSQPRKLNCEIRMTSQLRSSARAGRSGEILLQGKVPSDSAPNYLNVENPVKYDDAEGQGMHFAAVANIHSTAARVSPTADGGLKLEGASTAVIYVSAATGFRGFDVAPDLPLEKVLLAARKPLSRNAWMEYENILQAHLDDHRRLFRRTTLQIDTRRPSADTPTDRRVKNFAADPDPSLLALYFHYGRYLLMGSSRPGTQPANLQGIWSGDLRPPWSSNWTANINVQMNYWLAETCNLSECHQPLFDMIKDLAVNGRKTAATNYGASGWVSHHNIDLWRQSAPVGMGNESSSPTWANFCMSGPWLCQHLWEHFLFTDDLNFLRETAYPLMKGCAEFLIDWLVEDGKGNLTTCPSFSTENSFLDPAGKQAFTSAGCTLDLALIIELFGNCEKAGALLHTDGEFAARLKTIRGRLSPYQIGRYGQLQEWSVDFSESEPGQRHMSHLYPIYPGCEITPRSRPELAQAARKSLQLRIEHGGAYTGWSRAWAIGLWSRLGDGESAWDSLKMLIQQSTGINLFDTHPTDGGSIFQIDGNFGASAAIAEMLVQSHEGEIAFLPALPKDWPSGSVRGLRARGGAEVRVSWKDGAPLHAEVRAARDSQQKLRAPKGFKISTVKIANANTVKLAAPAEDLQLASFTAAAGSRYVVEFSKL